MKTRPIRAAIITFAAFSSGAWANDQATQLDGSSVGVVARKYTGESAKPFFNQFIARLRQVVQSGDPIMSKGAAKYLAKLETGDYYGYLHQTTRPITEKELQTGIHPENATDKPEIAGQITVDQTCHKSAGNAVTVMGVTYVAEMDAKGALAWVIQRSLMSLKPTCPDIAI